LSHEDECRRNGDLRLANFAGKQRQIAMRAIAAEDVEAEHPLEGAIE
jgi:hypothetical protein